MPSHLNRSPHSQAINEAIKNLEKLNPEQFELFFTRTASTKIESKDQEIDSVSKSEDLGISIRLIRDRKMGFSYTTSMDLGAVKKAVDTAWEVAQWMPEDEFISLNSFASYVYPAVDAHDSRAIQTPVSKKMDLAKNLESECRKADARITGVRSASVSESIAEVCLIDSQGEKIQHKSTLYTASVTCKAEDQGDSQTGNDFGFSNFLDHLDIKKVGRSAAQYATELLGAAGAPTMQCPAILRNSVVAELVDFLSSSFSAEEIAKGRSMLHGKEGQLLFSEKVTLIDDGLLEGGYGTSPFDGEGTPSRKNILVDQGFVTAALYDVYYGKKFSKEPTGSASRGIKGPPSIGICNLYLQNGNKTFERLFDGIQKGVFITELMGVHTANAVTGDFSLGASGILIENGKLTKPIRGFAVAGNILELFRRMTDISNDIRYFGNVGAPSVRISEISVGGT